MDEIEKVIKNSLFHPLFPHFPSLPPLRQGKKSNLINHQTGNSISLIRLYFETGRKAL